MSDWADIIHKTETKNSEIYEIVLTLKWMLCVDVPDEDWVSSGFFYCISLFDH